MPHLRLLRLLRLQSQHLQCRPITMSATVQQTGSLEGYHEELSVRDPDVFWLLRNEKLRQRRSVNLTASENYTSKAVLAALASSLTNKYSELRAGHEGRFYGGNTQVDAIEKLVSTRALQLFGLSEEVWGVNVHQLSGSAANLAAITGIVQPHHGRIMGLHGGDGGHGTHGYIKDGRKVTATSRFFETQAYRVDPKTSLIDYDGLLASAKTFRPHLIIAGISCYSRHLDYARFRAIADEVGALLLGDMAHVSGLVAAGLAPNPFEHCDVVTTTTHKTLRGPRAGLVFYRKGLRKCDGVDVDLEKQIFDSTYNGCLGGHHNNTLAAVAVALNEAMTPEFKVYQQNILINSKALCHALQSKGYHVLTDGTDNHIIMVDLRGVAVHARDVQDVLEEVGVNVNAIALPWEPAGVVSGLRLGTAALTSRSLSDIDMDIVAEFLHQGIQVAVDIHKTKGDGEDVSKMLQEPNIKQRLATLRAQAEFFAENHPLPGDDVL